MSILVIGKLNRYRMIFFFLEWKSLLSPIFWFARQMNLMEGYQGPNSRSGRLHATSKYLSYFIHQENCAYNIQWIPDLKIHPGEQRKFTSSALFRINTDPYLFRGGTFIPQRLHWMYLIATNIIIICHSHHCFRILYWLVDRRVVYSIVKLSAIRFSDSFTKGN